MADIMKLSDRTQPRRPPADDILETLALQTVHGALTFTAEHPDWGITVIIGPSGIGKTTAVERWIGVHGSVVVELTEFIAKPLELRPTALLCTLSQLSGGAQSGLLHLSLALGQQSQGKGSYLEDTLKRRCLALKTGNGCDCLLVVIDEAQFASVGLLEELRWLQETTEIGLVLVGNAALGTRVQELVEREPQIRRRFGSIVQLEARDSDIDLLCDARGATAAARKRVRELARLGGALGTVDFLLKRAGLLAGGKAPIDREHVETAAVMMGLAR